MVEEELLGVEKGPDDVLIGCLLLTLAKVGKGQVNLLTLRLPGLEPEVQFPELVLVRPFLILTEDSGPAVAGRNFPENLLGVQKVKTLGQVGIVGAFTFTGDLAFVAAKSFKEIRRNGGVEQL